MEAFCSNREQCLIESLMEDFVLESSLSAMLAVALVTEEDLTILASSAWLSSGSTTGAVGFFLRPKGFKIPDRVVFYQREPCVS